MKNLSIKLMKSKYSVLPGLLLFINALSAQATTKVVSSFDLETRGAGILVSEKDRLNGIECISCPFERISDNPINHFAIYSGLTHKLTINNKFEVETGLFLEERSFSGGSNTIDNWVVYPKILISGNDSLVVFDRKFRYKLMGGDFWNQDFNDMLRIHNLDYQGLNGELGYKNYTLGFLIVGDLATNVQLGLHQLHKFYINGAFDNIDVSLFLSDNYLTQRHAQPQDYNVGSHLNIDISDAIKVESQVELRLNRTLGTSYAMGIGLSGKMGDLEYDGKLKYYKTEFNRGYGTSRILSNEEAPYRDGGSYVGEQLYPLKNFYRTYSQWANYTKRSNRDLLGFELAVLWEKQLHDRIYFFTDIDLNVIGNPETLVGETIPLYLIGLRIRYFDYLRTEFYATNKFMNLNDFYQTFHASKAPFFGGSVTIDLKGIGRREMRNKDKELIHWI